MAEIVRLKPSRPCPICGKPSVQAFHPFCSSRCQDVDLHRWLSNAYVVPTDEAPEASKENTIPEDGED